MLILELRGASRHCALLLLLRQEVWLGDIGLFDSRVERGTHFGRQWNPRLCGCQRGKNRHMVRRISTINASTLCWCLRQLPDEGFVTGGEVCQQQKLKKPMMLAWPHFEPQTA